MGSTAQFIETKYIHQNGPYTCRGSVRDFNGVMYQTSDVQSIKLTVYERDVLDPNNYTPVTGYNNLTVDVSAIEERYGVKEDGTEVVYNFEYDLPTGVTPAFARRDWRYIVHFEIRPIVGRPTVIEAELKTLP